jgi:hypothetical protein
MLVDSAPSRPARDAGRVDAGNPGSAIECQVSSVRH